MKKFFLVIVSLLFVFVLTACEKVGQNVFNQTRVEGNLGAFNLSAPVNNGSVKTIPTFSWEASENAETYILEVASSEAFNQQEDSVYVKKAGISETTFKLFSNLKYKNQTYYWRVTAVNKDSKKVCNNVFSFFYEANLDEEIEYEIEHADEWEVHKEGSPVNVSIDSTNFFGNDKKALKIDFTHEIMNASNNVAHDGWAVVTHHQEEEMYGVDAFYFEFYYSGQDSSIWFRCVDEDNEYYNAEIKVANNTKQQVIIKFSDFTLRTKGGTPIVNQKFDYNMIKYVELVFEKTFGDGTCYVSNIKAINFDKYRYLFLDQLDFNEIDSDDITTDNYTFRQDYSDDGNEFTMGFAGDISGYGFTKFNINKFIESKNALKIKVKYQGPAGRILLRVIEEDKDRWVYKQDTSAIPEDGYLIIPIQAFTLSEYNGNGAREFYFIKQFQFGIEGVYGAGSIVFSDIKFVNVEDEIDNLYQSSVSADGLIENFNNYKANAELYYKWIISNQNKDEAIATNKTYQMGNNNLCGELTYKSDMFGAQYGLQFDKVNAGYSSISFKALDKSVLYIPDGANRFSHLTDANAVLAIYMFTEDHTFKYAINHLEGEWTQYVVAFSDFKLYEETLEEGTEEPVLKSEDIIGFGLELSYYYYLSNKKADPVYTSNNHVYFDDIYFGTEITTTQNSVYTKITTDPDTKITMIDNFNGYDSDDAVMDVWSIGNTNNYSSLTLEDMGEGNNCLKMQYKGNAESVSYVVPTIFASDATGKAISIDLKGDGKNNFFYINIYVSNGSQTLKLRAEIKGVTDEWKRYTIGFENFEVIEGSPSTYILYSKNVPNVQKITFGIKNYSDYNLSYFYLDNLCFDANASYTANTAEVIGE